MKYRAEFAERTIAHVNRPATRALAIDGAGTFRSQRFILASFVLAMLFGPAPAGAQWTSTGVLLCDHCYLPKIISDGQGGMFAAWTDERNSSSVHTEDDAYMQRLTANGYAAPGWPTEGLGVGAAPSSQYWPSIASDGQGGAFATWMDARNAPVSSYDAYVQRIDGAGATSPGWPQYGTAASQGPGYEYVPMVVPDESGGAFVAWQDDRNSPGSPEDIYVQHMNANGEVAAGWPQNGMPVCILPDYQGTFDMLPDDQGGVVIVWVDFRSGGREIYGLRLTAAGNRAAGWAENGNLLVRGRNNPRLVPDHAGGFYVAASVPGLHDYDPDRQHWIQRFRMNGGVAGGWTIDGVMVCDTPCMEMDVASDDAGGVVTTWYDLRASRDVYASRIRPDGTLAPGWSANGTRVSDGRGTYDAFNPVIAPDGAGGAYVVWGPGYDSGGPIAMIQHMTATGAPWPGWPTFGARVVPTAAGQTDPRVTADGLGGAIVVWEERGVPRIGLFATKFGLDGPVAALLSLATAEAERDLVRLTWQGSGAANLDATVERRTEASAAWQQLASITADASGRFAYEDRSVESGVRYAYRLRWREDGAELTTNEAWVDVPAALALALDGLRPNPAVRDLNVSFVLASRVPARIEVLDVSGRSRLSRDLGDFAPGRHTLRLGDASQLEPGVYWLRLTQGAERRMARGVVVR